MQGMMPVKTKSRVSENMGVTGGLVDARAKQVLREAVDAVVNSFAKHSEGYGRGTLSLLLAINDFLTIFDRDLVYNSINSYPIASLYNIFTINFYFTNL